VHFCTFPLASTEGDTSELHCASTTSLENEGISCHVASGDGGAVTRIYTYMMEQQFKADRRQRKEEYGL
jgi:hypothetical protein